MRYGKLMALAAIAAAAQTQGQTVLTAGSAATPAPPPGGRGHRRTVYDLNVHSGLTPLRKNDTGLSRREWRAAQRAARKAAP